MSTLGALLEDRDASRFVGRRAELAEVAELFAPGGGVRVVHLHGPAGIGKSTLLRELGRRGAAAGWTPRMVEGRDVAPTRAALARALAGVEDEERPLILFDTYERISGLDGLLRRELLRGLAAETRVVFAGRRAPDAGWSEDGWEAVTRTLDVGPLAEPDARALLAARGVPPSDHDGLLRSAGGSPLALQLLASVPGDDADTPEEPEAKIRTLVSRLTDTELDPVHRDVLAVAAIARLVTPALLADVLAEPNPHAALEWLTTRSFAEPLWGGFTVHDLVRRAVRADLRHRDPEREFALRRGIADHLHSRAIAGDVMLSIDLAHLLENPVLQWGYSWFGSDRLNADSLRPGDVHVLQTRMEALGRGRWWLLSEPLVRTAPSRVAVVRNLQNDPAGFTIAVTPTNAPPVAWEHPQLGGWLRHARDELATEEAVVWQCSIVLGEHGDGAVQAMLGMIGILRSGLRNPRYAYLPINRFTPGALDFAAAVGARHLPELDAVTDAGTTECHLLDYGTGGVLGMQRDMVYLETGAEPPPRDAFDVAEAVRDALRNADRPDELARNPLATGAGVPARAESLRRRLQDAIDAAFGAGPDERLLRDALTRGYFDPTLTHEQVADELHVSRATYFRKLRVATDRLCEFLAASG